MERQDTWASKKIRIGLFGIGLDTYWDQFEGLKKRLEGYIAFITEKLSDFDIEVISAGPIDNPDKAHKAADLFLKEQVEGIFLYISTYALSHTVLPVVQKVCAPIIILNLQPVPAIDYESFNALGDRGTMAGEWRAHCQACAVPEIANVFNNAFIKYILNPYKMN
jgi:L-arabinose isomerase